MKLYRYYGPDPLEQHKTGFVSQLILDQRLFFTDPTRFNDPFDGLPQFEPFLKKMEAASRRFVGSQIDQIEKKDPAPLLSFVKKIYQVSRRD